METTLELDIFLYSYFISKYNSLMQGQKRHISKMYKGIIDTYSIILTLRKNTTYKIHFTIH